MPCGQLLEGIRLYVKGLFLASIVDNIATELGLEHVVSVEDFGTKLAESQLGDTLSRGSQVHKYQRRIIALEFEIADRILKQLAELFRT